MDQRNKEKSKKSYRLKEIIKKDLGLTQKEFADKIGFGQSYINKLANRNEEIPISIAKKIKEVFHRSLDYTYGLTEDKFDIATAMLETFKSIFSEISVESQKYTSDDLQEVVNDFPMLSVDEYLYRFITDYGYLKLRRENDEINDTEFDYDLEQIKEYYIKNKGTGQIIKCLLIPTKKITNIVTLDKYNKDKIQEVRSIWWGYKPKTPAIKLRLTKQQEMKPDQQ